MRLTGLLLLLLVHFGLWSQDATVQGNVVTLKKQPLEDVKIGSQHLAAPYYTSADGTFRFTIPADQQVVLVFRYDSSEVRRTVTGKPGEVIRLGAVVFPIASLKEIKIKGDGYKDPIFKLPYIDLQKLPTGGVERTLVYTTAASSNNELTSNYNVRGGNYDENLVYVNGFQINRPFLTRSGQQEGLSFINTSLVKDIRFSAGGFDAKYGDKLSSVLDINYKTPDSLEASVMASLLGVEGYVGQKVTSRLNYLVGARYRANGYLLNSLPTKGAYNPVFWDAQTLVNYNITEDLVWSTIAHFSSNNYRFAPETQETSFGTVNEAYTYKVYYDGQEQTKFQTMTGGTSLKWAANKKTQLDFYAGVFNTDEREYFDIQGQYYINQLETDPGKEEFGDSIATVGIGTFLNHARNQLKATIVNVYHNGSYRINDRQRLSWGVNFQRDQFRDVLSEWRMLDSAGYTQPLQPAPAQLEMKELIKGKLALDAYRVSGFTQHVWEWSRVKNNYPVAVKVSRKDSLGNKYTVIYRDTLDASYRRFILNTGLRGGYTDVNQEVYMTPRVSLTYFPRSYFYRNDKVQRRNTQLRLSSGLYYQPPFYREFRTFDGKLNLNVKSQKSFHIVAGGDFNFNMWEREVPFKFSAEAYYKYFWDVNPYEVDNVRTRYYAENMAVAYAYGVDFNIHGEFIEGVESFFKVGFLSTKEDLKNDVYTEYYNKDGEKIIFGYTNDDKPVDSVIVHPGFIPRPTDQLMNFAILLQDRMPGYESLSAQLGLIFNTKLPYGPPDLNRYRDTLRQKSYFRVDLGLSYDFLYNKQKVRSKFASRFSDAIISFEVFNLLGINNVLSMQWIQDVNGRYSAIPNYLTQRRFNLKLILRI